MIVSTLVCSLMLTFQLLSMVQPVLGSGYTQNFIDRMRLTDLENKKIDELMRNGTQEHLASLLEEKKIDVNAVYAGGKTLLHLAIELIPKLVETLLKYGANPNIACNYGARVQLTPLQLACEQRPINKEVIGILLKNNASSVYNYDQAPWCWNRQVNIFEKFVAAEYNHGKLWSLIHYAVHLGDKELLQVIIDNGVDINTYCGHYAPLHTAVACNNLELVKFLIDYGVDVNLLTANGHSTPLHLAAQKGYVDIARYLLSKEATSDEAYDISANLPLCIAIKNDDIAMVKCLIEAKVDVNASDEEGLTAIIIAAGYGNKEIIEYLLASSAYMDDEPSGPVCIAPLHAAESGHIDAIEVFLKHGWRINDYDDSGRTMLHQAILFGQAKVIEFLLNHGASFETESFKGEYLDALLHDEFDRTELIRPNHSKLYIIQQLLAHGAPVSELSADNVEIKEALGMQSSLKHAVSVGNLKSVTSLLKNEGYACKEVLDFINVQRTQLFNAIEANTKEANKTVIHMLQRGFTLNTCDKEGNTLLHKAIQVGNQELVMLLLSLYAGREHFLLDDENIDPLSYEHVICKVYVDRIPQALNKKNKVGLTPLHFTPNNPEILKSIMQVCTFDSSSTRVFKRAHQ